MIQDKTARLYFYNRAVFTCFIAGTSRGGLCDPSRPQAPVEQLIYMLNAPPRTPTVVRACRYTVVQKGGQDAYGNAEQKPDSRKNRGDLPQKIEREMGIIPNVPVQTEVENTSCHKLHRRDDQSTKQRAKKQGTAGETAIGQINKTEADAATKCHGPVRIAAKCDFYEIISHGTEKK